LHEHKEVGVVGSFFNEIDDKGGLLGTRTFPVTHSEIIRNFRLGSSIMHPVVMFRKEIVTDIGGYDPNLKFAQEYDLWTRLAAKTRFANIPQVLFHYRTHKKATSRQSRGNQMAAHRKIRSVYWDRVPIEPIAPSRWKAETINSFRREYITLRGHTWAPDGLKKEFAIRRICEANLAYGAGRPDIGIRCLFELSLVFYRFPCRLFFYLARGAGFNLVWALARRIAELKLKKVRKDNPLFEW